MYGIFMYLYLPKLPKHEKPYVGTTYATPMHRLGYRRWNQKQRPYFRWDWYIYLHLV